MTDVSETAASGDLLVGSRGGALSAGLASRLRSARRRSGSQQQVARQLGISASYLCNLEAGKYRPSAVVAELLIDRLRLDAPTASRLRAAAATAAGRSHPGRRERP